MALYTDRWRDEFARVETADWIASAYDEAPAESLLDRTLYADQATYLSGDLLPKTDRMTMAHSLEARAPFLDVEWVEWTARLPARYKVRGSGPSGYSRLPLQINYLPRILARQTRF